MQKLLFFVLLITTLSTNAQLYDFYIPSKKTDLQEDQLTGNVKYCYKTTWKMVVKFGDPVKDKFTEKKEWYYNKKGMYDKGTLETDRMTEKAVFKYSYNKNNQIEETNRVFDSKTAINFTFVYDKAGNLIERNRTNKKDMLLQKDKYRYDSDGLLKSITLYTPDGKLDEMTEYGWNSEGLKSWEKLFDKNEEEKEKTSYKYDERGNVTRMERFVKSRSTNMDYKYDYTYNGQNQLSKKLISINGSTGEYIMNYDRYGNVVREAVRYGTQTTYKVNKQITYTYDKNGNWLTKQTEYEDLLGDKAFELEEREIKYW